MLKEEDGGVCFEGSKVNTDGESSLHSSWTSPGDSYKKCQSLMIKKLNDNHIDIILFKDFILS